MCTKKLKAQIKRIRLCYQQQGELGMRMHSLGMLLNLHRNVAKLTIVSNSLFMIDFQLKKTSIVYNGELVTTPSVS